jgi:hypothetical protein
MPRKSTRAGKLMAEPAPTSAALVPVKAHALALAIQADSDVPSVIMREGDTTLVVGRPYPMRGMTIDAAEVYYVDGIRALRPEGVWLGEADKVAWSDRATGYDCIMMRNRDRGYLSGYVGVPRDHPLYGYDHKAVPTGLGIDVHGGLSYSRICKDGPTPQRRIIYEARRICHAAVGHHPIRHASDHRVEHAWWFGFDCDHIYDVVPGDRRKGPGRYLAAETGAVYRDDAYVCAEVQHLAAQLRAIADGAPMPSRRGPPPPPPGLDPKEAR